MAKKGNVKKGFANYLLILFIAIIAAFFILVTIMLFSPFKSILGFKYFVYYGKGETFASVKQEDKVIDINYSLIDNIDIDCGYSNVSIKRAASKIDYGQVVIENNCSGFAREDQDTGFDYEVSFTDANYRNLKIKVVEPEGFLFFKKDISITLLTTVQQVNSFNHTKININSTKGDVYVGNRNILNQSASNDIAVKSLNIKNTEGDIFFFEQTSNINNLTIKTNNGNINANSSFSIDDLKLNAAKSKISLKSLTLQKAKLDLGNSEFNVGNLKVSDKADLFIKNGYVSIDELNGTLTSNSMINDMGKANIYINKINSGNIVIPNANNSTIKLGNVNASSQVYVRGRDCNASIDNLLGIAILETTKGNINISAENDEKSTAYPRVDVKTSSGNINLKYIIDKINDNYINLKSYSGKINVEVKHDVAFLLNVLNTKNEQRTSKNISVEGYGSDFEIPLKRNDGTSKLNIISDGKISVNFDE